MRILPQVFSRLGTRTILDGALALATVLLLVHGAWTLKTSLTAASGGGQGAGAGQGGDRGAGAGMALGSPIRALDVTSSQNAEATIALFFRQECGFCKASLPFYAELSRVRDSLGGRLQFIVAGPDDEKALRTFLHDQGVSPDRIQQVPLAAAGVAGTPTLVLLDRRGTVQRILVGQLNAGEQEEVRTWIRATSTTTH